VVVDVARVGVCGTVSAIGKGVDKQWLGRRIPGDTILGCGHCYPCLDRRGHVCENRFEIGIMAGWHAALAEKLLGKYVHWTAQKLPNSTFDGAIDCTDDHKTAATILLLI
jgi:threonine dehydrogenase-like Zn-dependent dehydrogenase